MEGQHYLGRQTILNQNKAGHDKEAVLVSKLVASICKDMFDFEGFTFHGHFQQNCQKDSVPPGLMMLVFMLLNGPNFTFEDRDVSQACLTDTVQCQEKTWK